MLSKLFPKPLELKVGDQVLKFCSIADFEFCMNGRTSVPSKKITQMVKFSVQQLKKEARTIKDIEKMFVAILSHSIEDQNSINRALRELDTTVFSQDHGWRNIINSLNEGEDEFNPFRRIALVKYMQYLSSRQEIIKYLYSEKQKMSGETAESADEKDEPNEFKDTLILEGTILGPDEKEDSKHVSFERMPKGEAVIITLTPNSEIEISLSKRKCKLVAKDGIKFVDQAGKQHELVIGRNVVGRDTVSTVKIDSSLRDVSRLHLVIENLGENSLQLTDMSSHGTYLPANILTTDTA
jgi:hypothetical protein